MLANAYITTLTEPGAPDRNGDVTAAGADAWIGRCPAYLRRVRTRVLSQSQATTGQQYVEWATAYRDMLVVQSPPQQLLSAVPGDDAQGWTVVVEDRRPVAQRTSRFRVVTVDHRAVGSRVDSLRLELSDEQAI